MWAPIQTGQLRKSHFFSPCHCFVYVWAYYFFCLPLATSLTTTYFAAYVLIIASSNIFTKQRTIFQTKIRKAYVLNDFAKSLHYPLQYSIPRIVVSANTNMAADEIALSLLCVYLGLFFLYCSTGNNCDTPFVAKIFAKCTIKKIIHFCKRFNVSFKV